MKWVLLVLCLFLVFEGAAASFNKDVYVEKAMRQSTSCDYYSSLPNNPENCHVMTCSLAFDYDSILSADFLDKTHTKTCGRCCPCGEGMGAYSWSCTAKLIPSIINRRLENTDEDADKIIFFYDDSSATYNSRFLKLSIWVFPKAEQCSGICDVFVQLSDLNTGITIRTYDSIGNLLQTSPLHTNTLLKNGILKLKGGEWNKIEFIHSKKPNSHLKAKLELVNQHVNTFFEKITPIPEQEALDKLDCERAGHRWVYSDNHNSWWCCGTVKATHRDCEGYDVDGIKVCNLLPGQGYTTGWDEILGDKMINRAAIENYNVELGTHCLVAGDGKTRTGQMAASKFQVDQGTCPETGLLFKSGVPIPNHINPQYCIKDDHSAKFPLFRQYGPSSDHWPRVYDEFVWVRNNEYSGGNHKTDFLYFFMFVNEPIADAKAYFRVDDDGWINFHKFDLFRTIDFVTGLTSRNSNNYCDIRLNRGWYFVEMSYNERGGDNQLTLELLFPDAVCNHIAWAGSTKPSLEHDVLDCSWLNPGQDCDEERFRGVCTNSGFDWLGEDKRTDGISYNENNLCCGDDVGLNFQDHGFINGDKICIVDNNGNGNWQTADQICPKPQFDYEDILLEDIAARDGRDGCCGDDDGLYCVGDGDPTCSGKNPVHCEAASGCRRIEGSCTGTPQICDGHNDMPTCEMAGCTWNHNNNLCSGITPHPCTHFVDSPTNCNRVGCTYSPQKCVPKPCSQFQTKEECASVSGCVATAGDHFFISSDQQYYCAKDYDARMPGGITTPGKGSWKWWQAFADFYNIHLVNLDETLSTVVSNAEHYYYCNADESVELSNTAAAVGLREKLPRAELRFSYVPFHNQYWPDTNCDGIPDCKQVEAAGDPNYCLNNDCSCEQGTCGRGVPCFGPMSGCQYQEISGNQLCTINADWNALFNACSSSSSYNPLRDPCLFDWIDTEDDWRPPFSNCVSEKGVYNLNLNPEVQLCFDGKDNDGNELIDCMDPKCYDDNKNQAWFNDWKEFNKGNKPDYVGPWDNCVVTREINCLSDSGDEDGDGLSNCDDPDCANLPYCKGETEGVIYVPDYDSFLCENYFGGNSFIECCPWGKTCNTNIYYAVSTGQTNRQLMHNNVLRDGRFKGQVYNIKPGSVRHVQFYVPHEGIQWNDFNSLTFSIFYQDTDFDIKVIGKKSDDNLIEKTFAKDVWRRKLSNLDFARVWHRITFSKDELPNFVKIEKIEFTGRTPIVVDNFKAKYDHEDPPLFCAGNGAWVADYDSDEGACNAQNPQGIQFGGFGGIGWTGPDTRCCGDDSTRSRMEYFAGDRGCFGGHVINNNKVVGNLFGTQNLVDDADDDTDDDDPEENGGGSGGGKGELDRGKSLNANQNKYRDILFVDKKFLQCDPWEDNFGDYNHITIDYVDEEYSLDNAGNRLIPLANRRTICAQEGNYFCSHTGFWLPRNHERDLYQKDEDPDKWFRCRLGSEEQVIFTHDWYLAFRGECAPSKCYCPVPCTDDDCDPVIEGYEECTSVDSDVHSCVDSGTTIGERVCVDGTWTTKTGLIANYLFQVENGPFVLTCNPVQADNYKTIYESELWKDDYPDSVCVLSFRDTVIIGVAAKSDQRLASFAELYGDNAEDERLAWKINVNKKLDRTQVPLDLSACVVSGVNRCLYNNDISNLKAYSAVADYSGILFFSNKANLNNEIRGIFEHIESLASSLLGNNGLIRTAREYYSWISQAQNVQVQELPDNLDRVYINKCGNDKYVFAYQQTRHDSSSQTLKTYLTLRIKGVTAAPYLAGFGTSLSLLASQPCAEGLCRLYEVPEDKKDRIMKLYEIRLDCS